MDMDITDCNCGFWKLDSISDFQSSFLLFVTFHIILGIKICLARSGDLVINKLFLKYWPKLNILSPRRDHTRTGNQRSAIVILIPLRMLTTTLSSKQFGHFCLKDRFNKHRRSVDKTNIKDYCQRVISGIRKVVEVNPKPSKDTYLNFIRPFPTLLKV